MRVIIKPLTQHYRMLYDSRWCWCWFLETERDPTLTSAVGYKKKHFVLNCISLHRPHGDVH